MEKFPERGSEDLECETAVLAIVRGLGIMADIRFEVSGSYTPATDSISRSNL